MQLRSGYTRADQFTLHTDAPARSRCRRWVEIVVTSVIVAVVWGLLSLPSVFYFLPQPQGGISLQQATSMGCANYTKQACLQALTQTKACLLGVEISSSNIMIAANVDQEANENTAQLVISGLPLLGATEMCTSAFIPFMCLYLFPLCDGNGTAHKPSRDQCIEISTVVCKNEWQKALTFSSVQQKLPNCGSLSIGNDIMCKGSSEILGGIDQPANSTQITCKDPFFFSNGTCLPQCGKWKQYDDRTSVAVDTIVILSAVLGLGAGALVLIFSCIWRKKMFVFPPVIIVYMSVTTIILAFIILVSLTGRTTLYCSSKNLIEAVDNSTGFCSFIGSLYYYAILQLSIWWTCHVAVLFWKIAFPFHAKRFEKRIIIHVLVVLLALLLPTVPVIVSFTTGGFVISNHPPLVCVSRSSDAAYYTLALPISVVMATGTSLLVLVLVTVMKHSRSVTGEISKTKIHFGTAERKLLVLFCYYVILGSEALIAFAVNAKNIGAFITAVTMYFACEAAGSGASGKCDSEKKAYESLNNVGIAVLAYILLGMLPAVSLLYVVQFGELKRHCTSCIKYQRSLLLGDDKHDL